MVKTKALTFILTYALYEIEIHKLFSGICFTNGLETIPENTQSRDGSTRLSRADGPQQKSGGMSEQFQQPSEIIQLPYHHHNNNPT